MPTERANGRMYLQRRIPGLGKQYRSLRTDRKGVARRRENAVLALAERGHQAAIQAWLDGDVDLATLVDAYESGTAHELAARARRPDATLPDACRAALDDKAPDVAPSTLSGYEVGLRRFRAHCAAEGVDGVRDVLRTDRLQAFKSWCRDEHDSADETINNYLTAISVLVSYAERQGWIDDRPQFKKYESTDRIVWLEGDDLASYFAELRPAFRPLMQVLLGSGLRLGEAEALTPADVRYAACGEARASVDDAKTAAGTRTVFLTAAAAEAVREHVEAKGRDATERIFQIPRRTVQKEHARARRRIGRPGYRIHDHRHTFAVQAARAGYPLHLLQQQLGHSTIEMTMKYARFHPAYTDVADYLDGVDRRLGLGGSGTDGAREAAPADVKRAAALLDVDPDVLRRALDDRPAANNSSNNTPAAEGAEAARA